MKNYLMALLLGVIGFSAQAVELAPGVVGEVTTFVGFAPPEFRGTFRFQLLSSGTLQSVDNHGQVKVVGSVSSEIVAGFEKKIAAIQSAELNAPQGPICMDAPGTHITVQQADGTDLVIWKRGGCRESTPVDYAASNVAEALKRLENAFQGLSYLLTSEQ